ncbi:MAG TPA: ComEA family DNA-binding protein [Ktedonobacteraceae bacterium]|nr:ComEA family DNA-binding protein [Ktedonobacteraceae bacterium]
MHLQMPQRFQEQWVRHSLSLRETIPSLQSLPPPAIADLQLPLPVTPPPQLPLVTFDQEQEQPSSPSAQPQKYLLWRLLAAATVLALMAALYFIWRPAPTDTPSTSIARQNFSSVPAPSRIPSAAATSGTDSGGTIQVYIVGSVKHPGVYILEVGARVYQLLQAAGGPQPDANLVALNLAARLSDGQEVYVFRLGETPPTYLGGAPGAADSTNTPLVNINTASVDELRQQLNISSKNAQTIVNYRLQHGDFTSVEQLSQILSKATYDKIKALVTVS